MLQKHLDVSENYVRQFFHFLEEKVLVSIPTLQIKFFAERIIFR